MFPLKRIVSVLVASTAIFAASSFAFADVPQPRPGVHQAKVAKQAKAESQSLTEQDVLALFKKKYPATAVSSVNKTDLPGIFEVVMGNNVAYTNGDVKYLILGHLFDMTTQTDITQARIDEMNKIDFSALPFNSAIKVVKGDGKRQFAVFTDPDCPYCKRLEKNLDSVDNYTMYVFFFGVHDTSEAHANAIWCADDKKTAWHNFMVGDVLPAVAKPACTTPYKDAFALGQKLNVQGTPTLFRPDGGRLPGALPTEQLNAWLDGKAVQMGR